MAQNENAQNNSDFLSTLFGCNDIICHTKRTNRDAILMELLKLLAREHDISNIEEIHRIIQERESDMPSVAGVGVAMPHARLDKLTKITLGIVTSEEGFSYTGDGQNLVHLLILILAPKADPEAYLHTLSSLAKICRNPDAAAHVAALKTPEAIRNYFKFEDQ
ncbi:MAG: PTS sugar transporter subunit IIA [Sedimentisphaerales bacterium]|nr:PTS sugar transporter subunit IIA [Sedimentisphaerales bacterium]